MPTSTPHSITHETTYHSACSPVHGFPLLWPFLAGLVLALAAPLAIASPSGAMPIPVPDGWRVAASKTYTAENLYNYIDGGAELFLEFGFTQCTTWRLTQGSQTLVVDGYKMSDPLAALGIYLARCAPEQPMDGIPCRNSGDRYQLMLLRGRWFVVLTNLDGHRSLVPVMRSLARRLAAAVPDTPVRLPAPMPRAHRVKGSLRLARGPIALQPIVTLGPGDILRLKRTHWAVIADYRTATGTITRIAVRYPDAKVSGRAFHRLVRNLDASYTVLTRDENRLAFRDGSGRFGEAVRAGRDLVIRLHLIRPPGHHDRPLASSHDSTGGTHP